MASSFPLHTASPALSTTRLDEISEDAEDGSGTSLPKAPARANSAKFGTARYKTERRVDQLMRAQQGRPASPLRSETAPNLTSSPPGGLKPSISQFLVREDSGTRSITSLTPSVASVTEYAGSIADSDITTTKETETIPDSADLEKAELPMTEPQVDVISPEPAASIGSPSIREPSPERSPQLSERPVSIAGSDRSSHMPQLSEQKTPDRSNPQFEEPFDFSYLEPKPKIKLGPRPVVTPERPRKSGTMGTSLLPSGYTAKKQEQQRPKSTGPVNNVQSQILAGLTTLPTPPPIPDVPEYNPRPISRGSVKSMPSQKSTTMTPEKMRLMKAVELRKRQMRKSNPQIRTPATVDEVPEVPDVPQDIGHERSERSVSPRPFDLESQPQKPDSGIDLQSAHGVGSEMPDPTVAPDHGPDGGELLTGEPADLLSKPTVPSDTMSQQPDAIVNADAHVDPPVETTDREQSGGAEHSPTPNHRELPSETSQVVAHVPTSEAELKEIEVKAEETTVPSDEITSGNTDVVNQNIDEATFSTSLENLITDVPAIVTTASSRPQTAEDETNTTINRTPSPGIPSSMESSGILAVETELSDLAKRRRGLMEPLHIDVETRRNSDAESLLDNDFLEELQSATFHDAKEMVVSKSPGPSTPFFPPHLGRSLSHESTNSRSRSPTKDVSITNGSSQIETPPVDFSPELMQQPRSGKSSSSVSPIDRHSPVASLKRNVSSGITKRIQALNQLSNREPSAVPVHIPSRGMSPDPAPVFLANDRRPPSMRSPHARAGSSYRLRPSADRASSFSNGSQRAEIPHVWSTSQDVTSNRDSVSVKARIVRPPTSGSVEKSNDSSNDLHESQIEINHSRGMPTPTPVSQAFLPPLPPSVPANPPSPDHRSLHSLRRKSFGRSKASTPGPVPAATEDVRSGAASIISNDEPSGSRTSRFFKRMSNFGNTSSKRRSVVSPVLSPIAPAVTSPFTSPVPTEPSPSRAPSVAIDRETPPAVQVGDLNVQFPDTLVSSNYPISSPVNSETNPSPALETPLALPRRLRPPAPLPAHFPPQPLQPNPNPPGEEIPPLRLQSPLRARPRPPRTAPQYLSGIHRRRWRWRWD